MKRIAVIVAMQKELKMILPLLDNLQENEIADYIMYSGELQGNEIVVMQCGIGKVNSAIATMVLLQQFDIDLVINTGVAGGADKQVNVMDVVVGSNIAYHDVWCGPGTEYGQAHGCPKYFESDPSYVSMVPDGAGIHKGLICSGDKFISSISEVEKIKSDFPEALAVDMESASIAQICFYNNVSLLVMRVISDSPGASNNNSAQYDDFWESAPRCVFNIVKDLLLRIK